MLDKANYSYQDISSPTELRPYAAAEPLVCHFLSSFLHSVLSHFHIPCELSVAKSFQP